MLAELPLGLTQRTGGAAVAEQQVTVETSHELGSGAVVDVPQADNQVAGAGSEETASESDQTLAAGGRAARRRNSTRVEADGKCTTS